MNYNGQSCKYRLNNGKVGKGKIIEGKRFRYILSSDNVPIKMENVKGLRLIEEEMDPALKSKIEDDLKTYDADKIKKLGDNKNSTIEDMAKLFLLNNPEYKKDAQKNGQAYTQLATKEFGGNEEELSAEEQKDKNDLEDRTDDIRNDESTRESLKNKFIHNLDIMPFKEKAKETSKEEDIEEGIEEDDDFEMPEYIDFEDNIKDFDTNDIYSALEDEDDILSDDSEYEEEEDEETINEPEEKENQIDGTIKLPDGSIIDISDLIIKIKIDVEDKIESILDEIEASEEDSFSDEKLIDTLSEVFNINGKQVLKEVGNVPDSVLKISEIARENILKSYMQK